MTLVAFPTGETQSHVNTDSFPNSKSSHVLTIASILILLGVFFCPSTLLAQGDVEVVKLRQQNAVDFRVMGKEADSIVGDIVLRNDHVACVIAAPRSDRNANMTVRGVGGCVIDMCERDRKNDQLSCYYPLAAGWSFHSEEFDSLLVDKVEVELDREVVSGQTIRLTYKSTKRPDGTRAEVSYELSADSPALKVISRVHNEGDKPVTITARDAFRTDRSFRYGVELDDQLFFAYDEWFHQAYGVVSLEGKVKRQEGGGVSIELQGMQPATIELGAGDELVNERYLVTGPSQLAVKGLAEELRGNSTHACKLSVADPKGAVGNARIELKQGETTFGVTRCNREGVAEFLVPAGEYDLVVEGLGRPSITKSLKVDGPVDSRLELESCGYIRCVITDENGGEIPCKVGYYGVEGTADPYFGPDSKAIAVQNLHYSATGTFRQAIAPGKYDVVISHGPEFDAIVQTVEVKQGEVTKVEGKLTPVVETPGWVSTEYHSHSSPSGDNTSSQFGRVLNLLAEHLEFAPCTEHNRIDSYHGHLRRLELEHAMATCSGMELTGSLLTANHQNAFPLKRKYLRQDGGGPKTDSNPVVQIQRLAAWDESSEKLVQTNHPEVMQIYDDRDRDGIADGGFQAMLDVMDVMEVHPLEDILKTPTTYPTAETRGNTIFHWLQLLNQGYRIPGVVNTDAHYNFHGSGGLRNYVASSTDNPAEISTDEMVASTKKGNVIMTSGPYLEVKMMSSAQDSTFATAGDDLLALSGKAKLEVKVSCPDWLDINRVQILVNGRARSDLNFTRRSHAELFTNQVVRFSHMIDLELMDDAHIIVIAAGEGLELGRVMGPSVGKRMPIAVSNPIFVDTNGDGFQANQDDLGAPFPKAAENN